MSFLVVYVTFPTLDEANLISSKLLEEKVIACYNTFSVNNGYNWLGKIENGSEIVSLLKTRKSNWNVIKQKIMKFHSYKIPCIIKFEVDSNEEFEKWIKDETKNYSIS